MHTLSSNRPQCARRLQGLLHRLKQIPTLLSEYDSLIKDQFQKGVIEKASDETTNQSSKVYYMPHHAVKYTQCMREDKKTTKLRVVYDASAKADGTSLNDCLYAGPKYDQNIFGIILRFRLHRAALVADIEKAFLQVSVVEKDRDALRFLWFDDVNKSEPDIVSFRFTRIPFGVTSSPYLLNATVQHHLNRHSTEFPDVVQEISRSIYVDDVAFGADNDDLVYELYLNSKSILKSGGFNLRKFLSNSKELQKRIDDTESQSQNISLPHSKKDGVCTQTHEITKVLGVKWDPDDDSLLIDLGDIAKEALNTVPTKRNVIRIASRLYDPLGFAAPVIVRMKVLFQEMCQEKLNWDESLPPNLQQKWQAQVTSLQDSPVICVPRFYFANCTQPLSCSLQGFCDASKVAYAAVIYLLINMACGCTTRFVTCKTRVSPVSQPTIPQLELLAALLLSKLMATTTQALSSHLTVDEPRYYTDSEVVLYWIKGLQKEWKQFVQNRVTQIRDLTCVQQWYHCPGCDNPADIPSRGADPKQLTESKLWLQGPDWLCDGIHRSENDSNSEMPQGCETEQKRKKGIHALLSTESQPNHCTGIEDLIACENFSSRTKLLRVTAYVLRAASLFKSKGASDCQGMPTAHDLDTAEKLWIMHLQNGLVQQKNFSDLKGQFGLFLDDEKLWRCGGRLQNADIPYATKHPLLLPRQHPFTLLLVRDAHSRVLHNGVKETLNELRSKYWIIKGRPLVKQIIRACTICRRYEGKSYNTPLPPPLPQFRVEQVPPFSYTGVDFAGPLLVKTGDNDQKSWICLFTCCVVRAIHLNLVPDMTTPTFLRCFKRFAARRGLPRKILSDNGKTFEAASKTICEVIEHPDVQAYMSRHGIEWQFNLPKAPWWGGVFERMVRSTKRCLKKMIGHAKLTYDELVTVLAEVEAVVNSRPIAYVSTADLDEALTPSHLLIGRRVLDLPDHLYPEPEDFELKPDILSRRNRYLNRLLSRFWEKWMKEYLLELQNAHRYHKGTSQENQVSVGDIVVVHDDLPRGFWKLGCVKKLLSGRDGTVRGATVRVTTNGKCTTLDRPLQRLYPMEIKSTSTESPTENSVSSSSKTPEQPTSDTEPSRSTRPLREAAQRANINRRTLIHELMEEDP